MVNEEIGPICVERILVSLDSSNHSFAALKSAVELARHYKAILKGVFIEDVALLSLAEMPFHQEVGEYSAIVREISTDDISRGIFVQSRWVIRTFQKLINQTDLQGNIAVLRGNVIQIIEQETGNCDLLIIGKSGTSPLKRQKLGSTTKALIQNQQRAMLLVEEGNHLGFPLIVFFDNSPLGKISLETGKDLLDQDQTMLILVNQDNLQEFKKAQIELNNWALNSEINISIQPYDLRSFSYLIQMITRHKVGLFILPHLKNHPKNKMVQTCLEKVNLPILLIPGQQAE